MPVLVLFKRGVEAGRTPCGPEPVLIGRLDPAKIKLEDPLVSGAHAKVFTFEGRWMVRDLQSRNGTFLNGARVSEAVLRIGDEVTIGNASIRFEAIDAGETPAIGIRAPAASPLPAASPERATTSRVALKSLRDSGFDVAREDDRLTVVWHGGEALNRLTERGAILDAVRALCAKVFEPARVFVGDPAEAPVRMVASEAATTGSALLSKSISGDERFKTSESAQSARIETAMAAPLLCRDQPIGVIYLDRLGGKPFHDRDLNLLGLIANHVTSTLEHATLIAEFEEAVRTRTAEVEQLLGIAAHDIRGPLATILGFIEIARSNLRASSRPDPDALDHDLGIVEDAARSVAALLTDLLDLKKIEAGKIRLEVTDFAAEEFLAESLGLATLQARQRGIKLSIECAGGLTFHGDRRRVAQALQNLVANALKFVRPGGSVIVEARRTAEGSELSVRDDGPGIAAEELNRLFAPYVQGEAGKKGGGTGLGLAIAKKLVEMHGGRIWAESDGRRGSRFAFGLPSS